jgi:tetratricopeptide (TPR) repeat protein
MIHPLRRLSALLALGIIVGLTRPGWLRAQEDDVLCGWPASQLQDGMPKTVLALKATVGSTIPEEALSRLRAWISTCSVHEGAQAVFQLKRLADANPNDAAIQTLYATALAHGPEVQVEGASGVVLRAGHKTSNSEKEAVRRFSEIVRKTRSETAATELATLALTTRSSKSLEAAESTLAALTLVNDSSGDVWLALADVQDALGEYERALASAKKAVALQNAAADRRVGIEMLMSATPSPAGAQVYLEGLNTSDQDVLDLYYEDLALLLTDDENKAWSALRPEERAKWLKASWEWRASISAQTVASRLAQHFQRMAFAFEHYRRTSFRGARPYTALWLDPHLQKEPLDDRGLAYVRHGGPDDVVRISLEKDFREGWYYRSLAGGRAFLEFNKKGPGNQVWGDYFMTEPFRCTDGAHGLVLPRVTPSSVGASGNITMMEQRARLAKEDYNGRVQALDPSLHADECSNTLAGDSGRFVLREPSGEARRIVSHAIMQTETATPRIAKPLQALLNTYAFKRADGTLVAAVGSMPGDRIIPASAPANYTMRLFAAIENASTHDVVRGDTTLEIRRGAPLTRDDLIRMPILLYGKPATTSTVRFGIRNVADTTQGQVLSTVREINAFGGNALALSDIVVGGRSDGSWLPGTTAPMPIPGHRLVAGSTFRVYYEMYGVKDGEQVHVTMRIVPGKAANAVAAITELVKKRQAMSIEFNDRAAVGANGAAAVQRDIGADLEPGAYHLEVTVETAGGVRATSRTEISVYGG